MTKIELSDEELTSLTMAIKKRYGIDFTNYEKKSLKRGFVRLIMKHKLGSVLGLWTKILRDKEYFITCIDDLTVNLTELFRNPEIWLKLKDDVLNNYIGSNNLDIWHAGCSTGEEVYTFSIVLKERNLLYKTKCLASDLSLTALSKAKEGKYSNVLLEKYSKTFNRYLPKGKLEHNFVQEDATWVVKDGLKKHIDFMQHDLVQDTMNKKFDIIFCRNVMIYFDTTLKMKVLKMFHECLNENGFFVIGYYDMVPEEAKPLFRVYDSATRIYKKEG